MTDQMKETVLRYKEDVPPPFDEILEALGIDALCYIIEEFGSSELYIPSSKRVFGGCLARQLAKDFTGDNQRELAKRYGLSVRTTRDILGRERKKARRSG